ncbi:MAG: hypothetical protein IPM54_11610 [Polyangiaceae bacterium]|nr:hypothetical protein [Polyangiaceae bacterium]
MTRPKLGAPSVPTDKPHDDRTARKECADSRDARCDHLVRADVKPAANERPCASYVEGQVR